MWISEKAAKCIIFLVIQMIQMLQFTCENLAVFSVGFAFLRSNEQEDDLTKRYPIAGNIGGMQVMRRLDKKMLSKYHLAMVGGQQKALPCQVDKDDKGVTKCYALGAPRDHADEDDKQGERSFTVRSVTV